MYLSRIKLPYSMIKYGPSIDYNQVVKLCVDPSGNGPQGSPGLKTCVYYMYTRIKDIRNLNPCYFQTQSSHDLLHSRDSDVECLKYTLDMNIPTSKHDTIPTRHQLTNKCHLISPVTMAMRSSV